VYRTDIELLQAFKDGERKAVEEVVLKYRPMCKKYHFAYRRYDPLLTFDDVVQEFYLRLRVFVNWFEFSVITGNPSALVTFHIKRMLWVITHPQRKRHTVLSIDLPSAHTGLSVLDELSKDYSDKEGDILGYVYKKIPLIKNEKNRWVVYAKLAGKTFREMAQEPPEGQKKVSFQSLMTRWQIEKAQVYRWFQEAIEIYS
jgi:hypothetical protein